MPFKFHREPILPAKKVVYAPSKRKLPKWQWYILALILFSPLFYLLSKWMMSLLLVTASGHIVSDTIDIRAPYDAYVQTIDVRLADKIKLGAPLITLDAPALNAQIAALQANIAQLKMHQEAYNNQSLPALLLAEKEAQIHVEKTKEYYTAIQDDSKKGLATVMDLSTAESRYHAAQNSFAQIQAQIASDQENFSITTQQNYDQILAPAEQQLASLQAIQKGLQINANQAGVITAINTHPFEFVPQGMSLMTLGMNQNWHVTAFFDGKDVESVHPGKKVALLMPDFTMLSGKIINQPSFAQSEMKSMVVLQSPEDKLVAYVSFDKPLPKNYQVNGMEVTVVLF